MRPMMHVPRALLLAAALVVGSPAHAVSLPSTQVAWVPAAAPADIDRAFATARAANKPLLLYWGATWCPPCNQLKATLFNRQDFAALSKSFVAVHIDGDRPGAQKLGQQFKVRGYPTLVLLRPDGTELTRLPGEAEAAQVMELLRLGLADGRAVKDVLADARAGKPIAAAEWRLLAFYSWETDDESLLAGTDAASVLAQLAPASAAAGAETATRLWLKAVAASDDGKGLKADDAVRARVRQVLADAAQVRAHADVIGGSAPAMVRALADTPEARQPWVAAFDPALRRLQADASLARADRLSALVSRIELARIELPRRELRPVLPEPLLHELRAHVAAADRGITDGYERQAVIPSAAHALERAGLWTESEALLQANLTRSVSPYYLMSQLGSLHRKLGRTRRGAALVCAGLRAGAKARRRGCSGAPATCSALVDLAPAQAAQHRGRGAPSCSAEAAQRQRRLLQAQRRARCSASARALQAWNQDGRRASQPAAAAGQAGHAVPARGQRRRPASALPHGAGGGAEVVRPTKLPPGCRVSATRGLAPSMGGPHAKETRCRFVRRNTRVPRDEPALEAAAARFDLGRLRR
jgi:thioredoxin-like negative regulator of GroEL